MRLVCCLACCRVRGVCVAKGFDFTCEEGGVDDGFGGVEGEVEWLREGNRSIMDIRCGNFAYLISELDVGHDEGVL